MLSGKTDEELMVQYQLGEADAFKELYARHSGKVLGWLQKRLNNRATAEEVFQATFLKLHNCRARYDSAYPFLPWLFTICRSELLDAVKKAHRKNETLMAEVPEGRSAVIESETPELDLTPLPAAQKSALELRYQKDFSFEEIAAQLETSPANARKLVSRAVQFLRGAHGQK